jgi:uncharacterized protein
LKIYLNLKEELKKESFKELEFDIPMNELDLPQEYIVKDGQSVSVKLHLLKDKDGYVITAIFNTSILMHCDRCLTEFSQKFNISESILFTKKHPKHQELSEAELYSEYLEDEEKFDVYDFIREEILVNTPMKLLCNEDCKGLCPYCGADKNVEQCDCEEKMRRKLSPFAKLESLKS